MTTFLFEKDKEVQIFTTALTKEKTKRINEAEAMSYVYITTNDEWRVRDPKTGNWITFIALGVPEIYRAQVLLLAAAYPD